MTARKRKRKKLTCDVCEKPFDTLGSYGGGDAEEWWVCFKCFEKADAIAEKEDRWPDAGDFARLKAQAS
jgi:hypothetical protein